MRIAVLIISCLLCMHTALHAQRMLPACSAVRTQHGTQIDLHAISDTLPIIVVRYLGAQCSHCVDQLRALQESSARIVKAGTRIYALSADDVETCLQTARRLSLDSTIITLCTDEENTVAQKLGCIIEEIDGTTTNLHLVMVLYRRAIVFEHYTLTPLMGFERVFDAVAAARQTATHR